MLCVPAVTKPFKEYFLDTQNKKIVVENIDSLSKTQTGSVINEVSKEVKVLDKKSHTSKLNKAMQEKWETLKEQLLELEDLELDPKNIQRKDQ